MSMGGHSVSGKTRPIVSMLTSKTYYPRFEKNHYFCRDFQLLFEEVEKMNIELTNCLDFQMINTLGTVCSFSMIPAEKFIKKKIPWKLQFPVDTEGCTLFFFEHNLFHQSRWSRTIDLNTTISISSINHAIVNKLNFWWTKKQSTFWRVWHIRCSRATRSFTHWHGHKIKWMFEILFKHCRSWTNHISPTNFTSKN